MKRTSTRRLKLSRQTLQTLGGDSLGDVKGGIPATIPITIPDSSFCPPRSFFATDCLLSYVLPC